MDSLPMTLTLIYASAMTIAAIGAVVAAKVKEQKPVPIKVEHDSQR